MQVLIKPCNLAQTAYSQAKGTKSTPLHTHVHVERSGLITLGLRRWRKLNQKQTKNKRFTDGSIVENGEGIYSRMHLYY